MIRRENQNPHNGLVSDERDKDVKYSDTGRDGDYSAGAPTSIEEGDEDYDDEMEERKQTSNDNLLEED